MPPLIIRNAYPFLGNGNFTKEQEEAIGIRYSRGGKYVGYEELCPPSRGPEAYCAAVRRGGKNVGEQHREVYGTGPRAGRSVLLVATPAHQDSFLAKMESIGIETEAAMRESRLLFLNAAETLARFMVKGILTPIALSVPSARWSARNRRK